MNEELMRVLAKATSLACREVTGPRPAALQASLDRARAVPADLGWERKAAAHAEFFTALADAAGDPRLWPVLSRGSALAYDLMIAAGRCADGIVTSSCERVLAHLRVGDAQMAALEMEKNLRVLQVMFRLTGRHS